MAVEPGNHERQAVAVGRPTGAGALAGLILRLVDTGDGITGDLSLAGGGPAGSFPNLVTETLYGQRPTNPAAAQIVQGAFSTSHLLVNSPLPAGAQGTDSTGTAGGTSVVAQFAKAVMSQMTIPQGLMTIRLRAEAAGSNLTHVAVRLRRANAAGALTTLDTLTVDVVPVVAAGSTLDFVWVLTVAANRAFAAGELLIIEVEFGVLADGVTYTLHHFRGSSEFYVTYNRVA